MLIEKFRHKGLRRLYDDDDPRALPAGSVRKIKAILAALESPLAGGDDAGLEAAPARTAGARTESR
jgi:hypothetical protein